MCKFYFDSWYLFYVINIDFLWFLLVYDFLIKCFIEMLYISCILRYMKKKISMIYDIKKY